MDYFFWDEILGKPSLIDGAGGEPAPDDAPTLSAELISVIIAVREDPGRPQNG